MSKPATHRINGFEQIKAFYSFVFDNQELNIKPQHMSLYMFMINQNNRNNWAEWFKCPYDLAMAGSGIGNKKTYYSCLNDLQEWELISYQKGINDYKSPLIRIEVRKSTSTVPQSVPLVTPLPTPQHIPLPTPLPTHIYKLVTSNLKRITDNIKEVVEFLDKKDKPKPNVKTESEYSDFHKMKVFFVEFYKNNTGSKYHFTGADATAIKQLEKKITEDLNGAQNILEFWEVLLNNLPQWYKDNLSLKVINSKYNELKTAIQQTNGGKQRAVNPRDMEEAIRRAADSIK